MGVTIHFEGRLKSKDALSHVRGMASEWAKRWQCDLIVLDAPSKKLQRVLDEKDVDYTGPVLGVQLQPHSDSEPLILEFDEELFIQEYCKTQFAPLGTHVGIIDALREIEPFFEWLKVDDEGRYWESGDVEDLRKAFEDFFIARDEAVAEDPELDGPYRLADGRIIDLMKPPEQSGPN